MSRHKALGVSAILILSVALVGCGGSSPGATVKAWTDAMNSGKYTEVEGFLSKQTLEFSKQGGASAIKDMSDMLTKQGTVTKVEVEEETITDNRATVKCKIHFKDNSVEPGEMTLVKEDGEWKINIG